MGTIGFPRAETAAQRIVKLMPAYPLPARIKCSGYIGDDIIDVFKSD